MVLWGGKQLKLETIIGLVNVISSDAEVSVDFLGLTVDSLPPAVVLPD